VLPRVEVWRDSSGRWRWRYLESIGGDQVAEFRGNRTFPTREAAAKAATSAYPDVPLADRSSPASRRRNPGHQARRWLLLAVLWFCLVTGSGVALAVALLVRRRRCGPTV
jgi:predicted lysophospholipase L1 biosynthesis ABC-type transport system permease subunit